MTLRPEDLYRCGFDGCEGQNADLEGSGFEKSVGAGAGGVAGGKDVVNQQDAAILCELGIGGEGAVEILAASGDRQGGLRRSHANPAEGSGFDPTAVGSGTKELRLIEAAVTATSPMDRYGDHEIVFAR